MRNLFTAYLVILLLFNPTTVSDSRLRLPAPISNFFQTQGFSGSGFVMCGTALAASGTVGPDDPRILSLEKELSKSKKSAPLFKIVPAKMTVDEPKRVTFGIDIRKMKLVDIINEWFQIYDNISTSILSNYSDVMEAKLSGEFFTVLPISASVQKFPTDNKITWDFSVTPLKPGVHKLHLEIYSIESAKNGSDRPVRTFRHEEDVYVSSTVQSLVKDTVGPQSTLGMLMVSIGGAVTILSALFGIRVYFYHKRRK